MPQSRHKTVMKARQFFFVCLITLFLTGCGIAGGDAANADGTPVPTPTKDAAGYQGIAAQACLLSDFSAMQSDKAQGDLTAWQPGADALAYMAPSQRSSWYIGEVTLASGKDFATRITLAPNVQASGDLTWSPSGKTLAFLAFRPNENVYTVMTVQADGSGLTDLFPTDLARTDARTSQKAIIGWKGENILQVLSSCGEECRQSYDIRLGQAAGPVLTPTPVANYRDLVDNLQISKRVQDYKPEDYPRGMSYPNWSPDDKLVAYLDKRALLWVITLKDKTIAPLDLGLRDVYETHWSSDSRFLSARAEDRIFVFQVKCQ